MGSEVSEALRRAVAERADHLCEYCLVHERDLYHGCEVDHIISVKHNGATVAENLAYACFHCNRHKGTDIGALPFGRQVLARFYNPRSDRWSSHFYYSENRIETLTETGEVTARLFEFNHPERIAFRKLLADTGRYPSIEALARIRD